MRVPIMITACEFLHSSLARSRRCRKTASGQPEAKLATPVAEPSCAALGVSIALRVSRIDAPVHRHVVGFQSSGPCVQLGAEQTRVDCTAWPVIPRQRDPCRRNGGCKAHGENWGVAALKAAPLESSAQGTRPRATVVRLN